MPVKDVADAWGSLLARIGEFFDILDLSFMVAGVLALGTVAATSAMLGAHLPIPESIMGHLAIIVVAYVCGLLCFAVGRWLRMHVLLRRRHATFDAYFAEVLAAHGLASEPPFQAYLSRSEVRGAWRLYVRLWAEVRDSPPRAGSFNLLRRYWVMAATFDGVALALVGWEVPVGVHLAQTPGARSLLVAAVCTGALAVVVAACTREAARYFEYQVEELVATIAAARADKTART